jgi:hypothetical protein
MTSLLDKHLQGYAGFDVVQVSQMMYFGTALAEETANDRLRTVVRRSSFLFILPLFQE